MKTESTYDFWSLLKEFEIKIPIVQRDYAQGRKTAFVDEIRTKFLLDIYYSIVNSRELNLDFVYGSIEDENLSNRKIFLPLDGQQRLTTLFLLHWYIAWKDGIIHENQEIRKIMSGFKYETRISSREFCNTLVNQNSLIYDEDIEQVSVAIRNEAWFFSSWIKDPTILSMLNMIDSIHEIFKETKDFSSKLFGLNNNIKFRFIELEKFGLDDSLYIKMNARGKLLTPFENFKANLEKRLRKLEVNKEIEEGQAGKIAIKFDTKWADLFWKYRDDKTNVYDNQFLYLLQTIISYHAFTISDQLPDINLGVEKDDYFLQHNYIKYVDGDFVRRLEKLLDFFAINLSDKQPYLTPFTIFKDNELFADIINNENVTISKHIKFYGYCLFILMNEDISKKVFENWMRVVSNLAENQIYNRPSEAQSSIKSLFKLSRHSRFILSYISEERNEITGFSKNIIEEERLKAQLIIKSKEWEKAILEAENNVYFRGQIIFLLKFAKVDLISKIKPIDKWNEDELNNVLNDFKLYYGKLSKIFYPDKLLVDENLWRRALLTKGDYLLNKRRNLSFVINTFDRDISWKRLLIEEKSKYVKKLIDELEFINVEKELKDIIDKYLKQSNGQDWYYYFIKYPELISREFCGSYLYIRYLDFDEIYLLKTSTTSGRIREYYTSVLYLELKNKLYDKNIKISCDPTPGISNPNYLKFSKCNGETIFLEYHKGWFYKCNEEDDGKEIGEKELINLLKKGKFITMSEV